MMTDLVPQKNAMMSKPQETSTFFQWFNKTSPYTFQHRGADLPSIFFFYYEERGKKEGILRENGKSSKSHLVHCHVASAPSLRAFFFRKFHKLPFSSIPILLLMETLDKILTMNMTFGTKEVSEYKRLFCLCLLLPINENDDKMRHEIGYKQTQDKYVFFTTLNMSFLCSQNIVKNDVAKYVRYFSHNRQNM